MLRNMTIFIDLSECYVTVSKADRVPLETAYYRLCTEVGTITAINMSSKKRSISISRKLIGRVFEAPKTHSTMAIIIYSLKKFQSLQQHTIPLSNLISFPFLPQSSSSIAPFVDFHVTVAALSLAGSYSVGKLRMVAFPTMMSTVFRNRVHTDSCTYGTPYLTQMSFNLGAPI
jgi:hypothetical protein